MLTPWFARLDLSTGTFNAIGDESTGILDISWSYVNVSVASFAITSPLTSQSEQ